MPRSETKRATDAARTTRPRQPDVRPAQTPVAPLDDLDTQLMLQVGAGNRDAANALFRRNFERIAKYITRIVGPHRPVEDLTQDVFVQAITHAKQFKPTAKVTTWLYRIATNTSLNYLKQPGVRRQVAEPADRPLEVSDEGTGLPESSLSQRELQERVAQSIADLPVNQRIALTLFQYEDCSYEQIATVLGTTVEAVRSLLGRARATLRRNLHGLR
jgi:RNA polymerase sigma-70 factor (ECF subfamily)